MAENVKGRLDPTRYFTATSEGGDLTLIYEDDARQMAGRRSFLPQAAGELLAGFAKAVVVRELGPGGDDESLIHHCRPVLLELAGNAEPPLEDARYKAFVEGINRVFPAVVQAAEGGAN